VSSTIIDPRKEKAMLAALKAVSKFLGKEDEYSQFIHYTETRENKEMPPDYEELAKNIPQWIRWLSVPLSKLYDDGYANGAEDATKS
jgi:hypothetical protein